jgi:hypothetical protein
MLDVSTVVLSFVGAVIGGGIAGFFAHRIGYAQGMRHAREAYEQMISGVITNVPHGQVPVIRLPHGAVPTTKLEPGSVILNRIAKGAVINYRVPDGSIKPD